MRCIVCQKQLAETVLEVGTPKDVVFGVLGIVKHLCFGFFERVHLRHRVLLRMMFFSETVGLAGNMGSSPLIGKTEAAIFSAAVAEIVCPMLPKPAVAVEPMIHAVARPPRSEAVQARIRGPVGCAS